MLKSDFSGQVRGQWTLRNSSMRKTWILRFHPTSPAQPLVRRHFDDDEAAASEEERWRRRR